MMTLNHIVASRGKAEILRLLFGLQARELHLRELTRRSSLALGTIQQELRRLIGAGLVQARKDGNRVYYQANQNNALYMDLRSIVIKTTGLANVLLDALQDRDIELEFVFGSIASETAGPESDVDLMVIGSLGLRRLSKLLSGTAEKIGQEINPHVFTKDEFVKRKDANDHFLSSILASPRLFVIGSEHELANLGK